MQTKPVVKRVMTDIDFSKESSHIALVGPVVGGPANGVDFALVMKSVNFSQETVEKMQKIKVTLTVPEFLEKFFHLYGSDAEVLARMLGYVPEETTEEEYDSNWYENMIQDRLASYEIIKSMKDSDPVEVLSKLDEKSYLKLMRDQFKLEKAFRKIERLQKSNQGDTVPEASPSTPLVVENTDVEATASEQTLEKSMSVKQEDTEMVAKSVLEASELKVNELIAEITKAKEKIAEYEAAAAEAVTKSRFAKVKAVVTDESKAKAIFKALSLLDSEEEFDAALKPIAEMQAVVAKSGIFEETGVSVDADEGEIKESAVAKALKAKIKK